MLRALVKRGLQTPVTITTDGAAGLTKALDTIWPKALRIRCWFHKMQNLQQKVPPQAWPEFKALVVRFANNVRVRLPLHNPAADQDGQPLAVAAELVHGPQS